MHPPESGIGPDCMLMILDDDRNRSENLDDSESVTYRKLSRIDFDFFEYVDNMEVSLLRHTGILRRQHPGDGA